MQLKVYALRTKMNSYLILKPAIASQFCSFPGGRCSPKSKEPFTVIKF